MAHKILPINTSLSIKRTDWHVEYLKNGNTISKTSEFISVIRFNEIVPIKSDGEFAWGP